MGKIVLDKLLQNSRNKMIKKMKRYGYVYNNSFTPFWNHLYYIDHLFEIGKDKFAKKEERKFIATLDYIDKFREKRKTKEINERIKENNIRIAARSAIKIIKSLNFKGINKKALLDLIKGFLFLDKKYKQGDN